MQRVANLGCSHCALIVCHRQTASCEEMGWNAQETLTFIRCSHCLPLSYLLCLGAMTSPKLGWLEELLYFLRWKYTYSTAFLRRCSKFIIYAFMFITMNNNFSTESEQHIPEKSMSGPVGVGPGKPLSHIVVQTTSLIIILNLSHLAF